MALAAADGRRPEIATPAGEVISSEATARNAFAGYMKRRRFASSTRPGLQLRVRLNKIMRSKTYPECRQRQPAEVIVLTT